MSGRPSYRVLLIAVLCCTVCSLAGTTLAASFPEFIDPHPAPGNQFGKDVVPLSTGNVVITSPYDDANGEDAGAVYLFNGATGALISTLTGSELQHIGSSGVVALANGNFLVRSPAWDNGLFAVGAVTWGSGTTGVSGVVSAANSLVGTRNQDLVGADPIFALPNGNYVVTCTACDRGATRDVGAVTWGNGTTGVSGAISIANSLMGSTLENFVGEGGITVLANGDFVVSSPDWDNGAVANVGAATWGSGMSGVSGFVSAANSLIGSTSGDRVGLRVTALTNGNYVVRSENWDNGAVADAGAVTWANGSTGVTGTVSPANSLVGAAAGDKVGFSLSPLTNGNYVVFSANWNNNRGAATWMNGAVPATGVVSAANSLVGSQAGDGGPGNGTGVRALSNGNYVVANPFWSNGAVQFVGAATWGNGTTGITGVISAANSLIGSTSGDQVGGDPGSTGVTALANGNYVVATRVWDNGAAVDVGAVTWGNGTTGVTGVVSVANSLVGSANGDGSGMGVTALANGNYVVARPQWDDGAIADAGAATWGNGTAGTSGVVSGANSLIGSTEDDRVAVKVTPLPNGNYLVVSPLWINGGIDIAGAVTWGSGTSGVTGPVSASNSLVGSTANDFVGWDGLTVLANGDYLVSSGGWDNGTIVDAGAVTWGSGTSGVTGVITAANSIIGASANDHVGGCCHGLLNTSLGVTALSDGNFVVRTSDWDNGTLVDAGAATWAGISDRGPVSIFNSLVGTTSNTNLQPIVEDVVNHTFIASFLDENEGSGRVRVGPMPAAAIMSAADIPADQGGWLRLMFHRSGLDDLAGSPPVTIYGVWRHIPDAAAALSHPNAGDIERVRAVLPSGLEIREIGGSIAIVSGSHAAEAAASFPPGTWELVTSVPAVQQGQYVVAVPTISNAAPNDFVVTAHTTTPSIWYISAVASGQSIDNLAPAPPTQLAASYAGGQTNLQWAANTEPDIGSYRVYRGGAGDFTPGSGNRIAIVVTPGYADVGAAGSYYKVSAVDVNGNESGYAAISPNGTTGVDDAGPIAFALHGVHPNPARGPALRVAFALPNGSPAQLELVDVGGRQVRSRDVGSLGTGRHTIDLAEGGRVAPGIYWVRLTQGANRSTARVAVIE